MNNEASTLVEKQSVFPIRCMENTDNFGDCLHYYIFKHMTDTVPILHPYSQDDSKHYLMVGSILRFATNNSIVWGSGFISFNDKMNYITWNQKKNNDALVKPLVTCVRGPLTRQKLLEMGVKCNRSLGDPCLLLPLLFNPEVKVTYKFGIIPHYVDKEHFSKKIPTYIMNNAKIIDILTTGDIDKINLFIIDIKSCDIIISSSLHGVIMGHAYEKPTIWAKFSEKIIGKDFKFYDYFLSIGVINATPMLTFNLNDINKKINEHKPKHNKLQARQRNLVMSCPFLDTEGKLRYLDMINN